MVDAVPPDVLAGLPTQVHLPTLQGSTPLLPTHSATTTPIPATTRTAPATTPATAIATAITTSTTAIPTATAAVAVADATPNVIQGILAKIPNQPTSSSSSYPTEKKVRVKLDVRSPPGLHLASVTPQPVLREKPPTKIQEFLKDHRPTEEADAPRTPQAIQVKLRAGYPLLTQGFYLPT